MNKLSQDLKINDNFNCIVIDESINRVINRTQQYAFHRFFLYRQIYMTPQYQFIFIIKITKDNTSLEFLSSFCDCVLC